MTRRRSTSSACRSTSGRAGAGVDMGPSALRIAGIDQRIAALGHAVIDKGDLPVPIPETREPGRPDEEVHPRDRPRLSAAAPRRRSAA